MYTISVLLVCVCSCLCLCACVCVCYMFNFCKRFHGTQSTKEGHLMLPMAVFVDIFQHMSSWQNYWINRVVRGWSWELRRQKLENKQSPIWNWCPAFIWTWIRGYRFLVVPYRSYRFGRCLWGAFHIALACCWRYIGRTHRYRYRWILSLYHVDPHAGHPPCGTEKV